MVIAPQLESIKHTERAHHHNCMMFPPGFLWGASTSAHQVEGNNLNSDWWQWEQQDGKIKDGTSSGESSDHYNRFAEDFDLAQKLKHNAHRLSVEWARIEPKPGKWNQAALDHYKDVLTALRQRNIKSIVTLHHFTVPIWFADRGGWLNKRAVSDFSHYTQKVVEQLGQLVDLWITINEPMVLATQAYTYAAWPPQKASTWLTSLVVWRLARAHAAAYKIIHKKIPQAQVGYANNVMSFETYNKRSLIDFIYVAFSAWLWNHGFYRWSGKRHHDFIGVNYYFHQRIRRDGFKFWNFIDPRAEGREHSDLGWEIFPKGLFNVLLDLRGYKLPIYITENGIASVNDNKRVRFIISHLREVYHAITQGVDIKGYLHWSLLDNFEWDKGFEPRFGLIGINYTSKKRTVKPSANVLRDIAKDNALCHDMLKYLGHTITYDK